MAVKIRLAPKGKKKQKVYQIVIADAKAPLKGRFLEVIGFYNPIKKPSTFLIDEEKVMNWLNKGAIPTDTVKSLLRAKGILYRKHLLEGVRKGAFSFKEMEVKFQIWKNEKLEKVERWIDAELEYVESNRMSDVPSPKFIDHSKYLFFEAKKKTVLKKRLWLVETNEERIYQSITENSEKMLPQDSSKNPFALDVEIHLDNEKGNVLTKDQRYTMTINIDLEDAKKRANLKHELGVMLTPQLSNIEGNFFNKFIFNEKQIGKATFKLIPEQTGKEVVFVDFLQNSALLQSLPLTFIIQE